MNIGLIVDIVLAVLTIFIIIKFAIKGFFSSVLDVCKLGISAIVAYLVRVPIAKLLCALFMNNVMYKAIESSLNAYLAEDISKISIDITSLAERTPEVFEKFLTKFGLDYEKFLTELNLLTTRKYDDPAQLIDSISSNVGGAVAMLISVVITLIAVFIVSYIVLIIASRLLNSLTKFDGVKQANRWLGAGVGVIVALLIMWAISMGLLALVEFVGPFAPTVINSDLTEKSMIVGIFKNINLIDFIKSKIYK